MNNTINSIAACITEANTRLVKTIKLDELKQMSLFLPLTLILLMEEKGLITEEERRSLIEDSKDFASDTVVQLPEYLI